MRATGPMADDGKGERSPHHLMMLASEHMSYTMSGHGVRYQANEMVTLTDL